MSLTRLAIRILLPIVLLTTCTGDTMVSPGISVRSQMDVTGLFRAGDQFGIPIDRVDLELRRVSDNSVAFSRTLTAAEWAASGGNLTIALQLDLDTSPEDFSFLATVFSGGIEYYRASGTITALANQSVQTSPLTPTYTGPGANATAINFTLNASVGNGVAIPLSAIVLNGTTPVTGVPVVYLSSDSNLLKPVATGLNTATLTTPATGSGRVTITARTPTGLSATGTVSWAPPVATSIALISGDAQTIGLSTVSQPLVVEVRDAAGAPFTSGYPVTFAVTAGPAGAYVLPTATTSDAAGRAQTLVYSAAAAGTVSVSATATGLSGSPVLFTTTISGAVLPPSVVLAELRRSTQNATVSTAVGSPPSVKVTDANSMPLRNVSVTFA